LDDKEAVTHIECILCKAKILCDTEHLQELIDDNKNNFEVRLAEIDKRYEQRFTSQQEATKSALASAQMAVDKAELNAERWRANANEWRGSMNDKDKLFMPRNEVNPRLDAVDKGLSELNTFRDTAIGKASQNSMIITLVIALAGLIIGVVRLFK
jgi:CHASE3 domain sensor protein